MRLGNRMKRLECLWRACCCAGTGLAALETTGLDRVGRTRRRPEEALERSARQHMGNEGCNASSRLYLSCEAGTPP